MSRTPNRSVEQQTQESTMMNRNATPNRKQVEELLYQALETELGGIQIYGHAIRCAQNPELKREWMDYLAETTQHRDILLATFKALGLDPQAQTPGRRIVGHIGLSLVSAMQQAMAAGDPVAAELVAGECVTLAETKDHQNWELIGQVAKQWDAPEAKLLKDAYDQVEDQEDHHLYHSKGWTRELWLQSLGLPAVLPPPEEVRHVDTAIEAARAEQSRKQMLQQQT
jgi:rubrerythrin